MSISTKIYDIQDKGFTLFIILSYILYIITALGIFANAPAYLDTLQYYAKIYICLFLIIRFNPFKKVEFTDLDRKVAFSSGLFLLSTTIINQILIAYLTDINSYVYSFIHSKNV